MLTAAVAIRLACAASPELLWRAFRGQWPSVPVVLVGRAGSTFAEELAFRGLLLPPTVHAFGRRRGARVPACATRLEVLGP